MSLYLDRLFQREIEREEEQRDGIEPKHQVEEAIVPGKKKMKRIRNLRKDFMRHEMSPRHQQIRKQMIQKPEAPPGIFMEFISHLSKKNSVMPSDKVLIQHQKDLIRLKTLLGCTPHQEEKDARMEHMMNQMEAMMNRMDRVEAKLQEEKVENFKLKQELNSKDKAINELYASFVDLDGKYKDLEDERQKNNENLKTINKRYSSLSQSQMELTRNFGQFFDKKDEDEQKAKLLEKSVAELEELKDQNQCLICMDQQKNVLFLPCLHVCICSKCKDTYMKDNNECPLCRQKIEDVIENIIY